MTQRSLLKLEVIVCLTKYLKSNKIKKMHNSLNGIALGVHQNALKESDTKLRVKYRHLNYILMSKVSVISIRCSDQ